MAKGGVIPGIMIITEQSEGLIKFTIILAVYLILVYKVLTLKE